MRTFLHEVAGEWEEVLAENQKLRDGDPRPARERLRQYQDQDRIFRETLLHAQRTKEELLDAANREKALILKEADFKADEIDPRGPGRTWWNWRPRSATSSWSGCACCRTWIP